MFLHSYFGTFFFSFPSSSFNIFVNNFVMSLALVLLNQLEAS
jgi:hypothetical protein